MYDFETEYRKIFEMPLEEIKEDIFFRVDNFQNERWYGDLQMFMAIGVCESDRESASNLQKALKVIVYTTQTKERNGRLYLVPEKKVQKQSPAHRHEDREREGGENDWK